MFDVTNIAQLIPLGGVTFLLIYLVGTFVSDRAQGRDREQEMKAAHEQEIRELRAQHREDLLNATADQREQLEFQRNRITQLVSELQECRKEHG